MEKSTQFYLSGVAIAAVFFFETSIGIERAAASNHTPLLKWGISQEASDSLRSMGIVSSQVMQTIGNAPASGGTHLRDGDDSEGNPYCAATDISVRHPTRLTQAQIRNLLDTLARHGFAAYYREPGHDHWPRGDVEHIHAIFAGLPMKRSLQEQIHDWLHGKNGLASHASYLFWQPSGTDEDIIRNSFLDVNPATPN